VFNRSTLRPPLGATCIMNFISLNSYSPRIWVRRYLLVALVTAGSATMSSAQTINLVCGGTLHQYQPQKKEGDVVPAGTIVDLTAEKIATPVGEFRISAIEEKEITFEAPGKDPIVFGTLDRLTGAMNVFWRRRDDQSKMIMYAELKCSVAQRLF
jgi:hypothetical protein